MNKLGIKTKNGNVIIAQIFEAKKNNVLIIASATGVKQEFYKKFASFISSKGITVFTFDYSGIGLSLNQPIKDLTDNASDWGNNDLEAIIVYAKATYPDAMITLLGHSIGGQLIGLAKSSVKVQKIILIATQSGYWKFWDGSSRIKMWFNWHILFPLLINSFGYLPSRKFSRMENLPKNVAKQWSNWSKNANYLFNEISEKDCYYNKIFAKTVAISIENDKYAPKEAVDWFTAKFKNANLKKLHLMPNDYNSSDIGHFGLFSSRFESTLWNLLLSEIDDFI